MVARAFAAIGLRLAAIGALLLFLAFYAGNLIHAKYAFFILCVSCACLLVSLICLCVSLKRDNRSQQCRNL